MAKNIVFKMKNYYKLIVTLILFTSSNYAVSKSEIYDNSWALIIGINEYKNVPELNYAVEDAIAIKNILINDFNFNRKNIEVLLDGEATQNKIQFALNDLVKKADSNDRVIFYFAGHGETEELGLDGGNMGFLIPVDGDPDQLYLTGIPMDELKRVSKWSNSKHMLFLVDACYGGLAAMNTRSISSDTPGYIDKIVQDYSRQIITAGGTDEKVMEKDEWEHSAFTKNIISGLKEKKADLNSDGFITGEELGMYVKEGVTVDTDNYQTPQVRRFTSHEGEVVFLTEPEQDKTKGLDEPPQDLQKLVELMTLQLQNTQNQKPLKTKEKVILPGSKGFYNKSFTTFLVEEIFYSPGGLKYRGKLKQNIQVEESLSWSPTVTVPLVDILETEDSKIGHYIYSTGKIE